MRPVKPPRPKRAAGVKATAAIDVSGDVAAQSVEPVAEVKSAAGKRKASARKKSAVEAVVADAGSVEPVPAPKPRKRPAVRAKKSAASAADEAKE